MVACQEAQVLLVLQSASYVVGYRQALTIMATGQLVVLSHCKEQRFFISDVATTLQMVRHALPIIVVDRPQARGELDTPF